MREQTLKNSIFFIQRYEYPLIIDEIQYAPILMEVIDQPLIKKDLKKEVSMVYLF